MIKQTNVTRVVMTALMMGIIMVATMFIKFVVPMTQEYVHLGDAMIFFAVLILGWKYGAAAAAFGAAFADILGGFAMWAPWTFVIKAIMAVIMGLFISATADKKQASIAGLPILQIVGMILAGAVMVFGYYFASGIMFGNWVSALVGVPFNIAQFIVGMAIASALTAALKNTSAKKYFFY